MTYFWSKEFSNLQQIKIDTLSSISVRITFVILFKLSSHSLGKTCEEKTLATLTAQNDINSTGKHYLNFLSYQIKFQTTEFIITFEKNVVLKFYRRVNNATK